MAYVKTVWEDLPSTNTPVSASNLNKIENELETLDTSVTALQTTVASIIETGSNANARYVKYSDGTLIQFGKVSLQSYNGRSSGGLTYWSKDEYVTLPYNFINTNYIITTNVELANMNVFCQSYANVEDTDRLRISFISTVDEDSRVIDFICIGRWKN